MKSILCTLSEFECNSIGKVHFIRRVNENIVLRRFWILIFLFLDLSKTLKLSLPWFLSWAILYFFLCDLTLFHQGIREAHIAEGVYSTCHYCLTLGPFRDIRDGMELFLDGLLVETSTIMLIKCLTNVMFFAASAQNLDSQIKKSPKSKIAKIHKALTLPIFYHTGTIFCSSLSVHKPKRYKAKPNPWQPFCISANLSFLDFGWPLLLTWRIVKAQTCIKI